MGASGGGGSGIWADSPLKTGLGGGSGSSSSSGGGSGSSSREWSFVTSIDELSQTKSRNAIFYGFREGSIKFPPR